MNRRIKMIGMDLDGTLLTNKKELPPYTRSVLKKAIDAGIELSGNTISVPEDAANATYTVTL